MTDPTPKLTLEMFNTVKEYLIHLNGVYDDDTTAVGVAPCDIEPDDILTLDFTAPIAERIIKVERNGVVIYEASK